MIIKYKRFVESRGIPTPTLIYLDAIYERIEKNLMSYLKSKENSIVYNNIIRTNDIHPEFPVSIIKLKSKFDPTPEDYGWLYSSTGDCRPFIKGGSKILEDGSILLVFEIGTLLERKFLSKKNLNGLKTEIKSSIHHELNHGYEHYNRKIKGYPHVQDALTFAVDINKSNVPNDVWEHWHNNISFNLYYTEKFEINAISQESVPYIISRGLKKAKKEWQGWKVIDDLISFKSEKFKSEMIEIINESMPGQDPMMIMSKIKMGLADSLEELMNKYKENNPSISPDSIRKMSIDKFLKYCESRFNKSGEDLKRRVLRNLTNKDIEKRY